MSVRFPAALHGCERNPSGSSPGVPDGRVAFGARGFEHGAGRYVIGRRGVHASAGDAIVVKYQPELVHWKGVAMKIGIIGAGRVGSACAFALVIRGLAREVVLVDRTRARAKAVATDIRYGAPLSERSDIRDGDYADLGGAGVVMITSGVNEKAGGATDRNDPEGRLRLLDKNAEIYRDMVPKIVAAAPDAVLLVATDPPDPLADLARVVAKHNRVLSTGTWLDSLRFQTHLASILRVSPASVEAQILGEHGTSEVFIWSGVRIGGISLKQVVSARGMSVDKLREGIERDVRYANITIIEGNEASQYGIGMVSARIAEVVLRDEGVVLPIGSYSKRFGVTLSLPSVLGREGVRETFQPELSAEEEELLARGAEALRRAAARAGASEG
jgi:L-lactate dehydrogenase